MYRPMPPVFVQCERCEGAFQHPDPCTRCKGRGGYHAHPFTGEPIPRTVHEQFRKRTFGDVVAAGAIGLFMVLGILAVIFY